MELLMDLANFLGMMEEYTKGYLREINKMEWDYSNMQIKINIF